MQQSRALRAVYPLETSLDDEPQSWPEPVIAGRYRIGTLLGQGAVSHVFTAVDEELCRSVAIKLLAPYGSHPVVTRARVEAEMRFSRAVVHGNVVEVLDAGHTESGRPYLVLENLEGETLGQVLRRKGAISVEAALRLTREAARGLSAAHRVGVVHRDVKPDNLFLCAERHHGVSVKVIDFGFATFAGATEEDPLHVVCTPGYIAPEQAVGEPVDARADVYALGVVLFRALTGELPFDGCGERGMLAHHVSSRLPPPSWLRDGIAANIDDLVQSAVRKHPDNRYASMDSFLQDIDRALSGRRVVGAPLVVTPDAFAPKTELGRRASAALASGEYRIGQSAA